MKKIPLNFDFLPAPTAKFNRATELELDRYKVLIVSGTASVGENCQTQHPYDFEKQVEYTYDNVKNILGSRGYAITDIVQWRVYLKDINKTYDAFNKCRDKFFQENNIYQDDYGSSVCVEAKICRDDLLIEMEALAIKK